MTDLRDFVPDDASDVFEIDEAELRSRIPEIAKTPSLVERIERGASMVPTQHEILEGDSRAAGIDDGSVDLVVTSPPYFDLVEYENSTGENLGDFESYEGFLDALDDVIETCFDALVEGGRACVVVGDVLRSRSKHGRHEVLPLHADIQQIARDTGFESLAPIFWNKIGNASAEQGSGARFFGKPYEPGAVVKNDVEYVLLFRKPGGYRSPSVEQRVLSLIGREDHRKYFTQTWDDVSGERRDSHPAPYPEEIAERLVRMFSFVGDTVLDPFAGTGTTSVAASRWGRDSISIELEPEYVETIEDRLVTERSDMLNYDNMTHDVNRVTGGD